MEHPVFTHDLADATCACLDQVAQLLATPAHWCQHVYARNAQGVAVHTDAPDAVAWDLRGAVMHTHAGTEAHQAVCALLAQAISELYPLQLFNDDRRTTVADCHRVLTQAKALLEQRLADA